MFIKLTVDKILYDLKDDRCKILLNVYSFDEDSIIKYDPDKYDVIHIHNKHIDSIDIDQWVLCSRYSGATLVASIYGSSDLIKKINNNHCDIEDMPIVVTNYDINNDLISYRDKLTDKMFSFKNIKYIVSNEVQKSYIIKQGLAIGYMPQVFYESLLKSDASIINVGSVDVDCILDPSLVLINKDTKHLKQLVSLYRAVESDFK